MRLLLDMRPTRRLDVVWTSGRWRRRPVAVGTKLGGLRSYRLKVTAVTFAM
jgi:hypothetical protein